MTLTNVAKIVLSFHIISGFIAFSVLHLNVAPQIELALAMFLGGLIGIFMGYIRGEDD